MGVRVPPFAPVNSEQVSAANSFRLAPDPRQLPISLPASFCISLCGVEWLPSGKRRWCAAREGRREWELRFGDKDNRASGCRRASDSLALCSLKRGCQGHSRSGGAADRYVLTPDEG